MVTWELYCVMNEGAEFYKSVDVMDGLRGHA